MPSRHKADGPNQVWMWDITWLPGAIRGLYYYLYLILDLYSRKIVGWGIWPEETAEHDAYPLQKIPIERRYESTEPHKWRRSDTGVRYILQKKDCPVILANNFFQVTRQLA